MAVFHSVRARVLSCNLQDNLFAFRAVTAKDATMEVVGNSIQGDLWFDSTRPGNLVLPSLETPFPPRASAAATRVAHLPA